jgi:hypothetical protein
MRTAQAGAGIEGRVANRRRRAGRDGVSLKDHSLALAATRPAWERGISE